MIAQLSAALLLLASPAPPEADPVLPELRNLQGQVAALRLELLAHAASAEALRKELSALAEELRGLKDRPGFPVSLPFLAGPPPSSDSVGVAKVAVLAPRVEVEALRRHDLVFLKVRRIELAAVRAVGEVELGTDQIGVDLPLDQSGALYIVDWSTSEGYSVSLVLRDGATGQPAATVQVKPLQNQGRFVFVGYRVE